jgi:hypothetical protein
MNELVRCRVCDFVKGRSAFYAGHIRRDGSAGKCKECVKASVHANRHARLEYYREYDRQRGALEHRKQANRIRAAATPPRPAKQWREAHPEKYRAHVIVGNALRDGKLGRGVACEACGCAPPLEAHHDDYDKPLHVRWLCRDCHAAHHKQLNEFRRQQARAA